MKLVALPLSLILVLGTFAAPATAQAGPDADAVLCVHVATDIPVEDIDPAELGQLLIDGGATVEVVAAGACVAEEPTLTAAPEATDGPLPTAEPVPTAVPEATAVPSAVSTGTSYTEFVAHGAGAAIELAALAERHDGAETLRQVDAMARSLATWSKRQRRWLDNHPPQPCYRSIHKQWRKGVTQVNTGAKAARQAIATLKPAPMRKAVRQIVAGAENLADVDLDAASDRCASVS